MGIFSSCLVFFSLFIKLFNSRFLLKIRHKYKIWAVLLISTLADILLIVGMKARIFELTIVATLLIGLGIGLGTCTIFGFMKGFPPLVISGFSSGTGFSGIIGASLYLVFKLYNISLTNTVLALFFFYPLYGLAFYMAIRLKDKIDCQIEEKLKKFQVYSF